MRKLAILLFCVRAWAGSCEGLAAIRLAHSTVDKAESIAGGTFTPPTGPPLQNLQPFCRVAVMARPSSDSEIGIEIWMPESNWNGRLEGTGNGGFAGHIGYGALAAGVKLGYAVVNTDMGMATPPKADASIFVNRPERWADWGYRATHEMTVIAKQIVKTYYDQPLKHSYFVGCSTGGEQALMEAQRFPNDYDGIVSGAPAHNRTGVHMSILWNFAVVETNPAGYLPSAKLQLISTAVLAACDAVDAVKDGIIADPRKCNFDPAVLRCTDANSDNCLTPPQVDAVRRLYAGPANLRTGESIYPGLPKGSEFGWDHLGPAPALATEPPFAPIFKWVFGPQWDWRSFHFDGSAAAFENKLASTLNATNPNIDAFKSHGGKIILYHGWADWLVPPEETIRYYDAVAARDRHLGVTTNDSLRLFMIAGMAHCGSGPGPDQFDALGAVVQWVEKRVPPQNLIATKIVNHMPAFRRLLCPFPQIAVYRGSGDANDDRSYACMGTAETSEKEQH